MASIVESTFSVWNAAVEFSGFRRGMHVTLAWHASAAYGDLAGASVGLLESGFKAVHTFDHRGAAGYVAVRDDYAIIAIRGTDQRQDWKGNLDAALRPWVELTGRVHRGFLRQTEQVYLDVQQGLQAAETNVRLYITGHSLGGPAAVLLGQMLENRACDVAQLNGSRGVRPGGVRCGD